MNTLLTIGYRGRTLAWLLRQLRQHRVDALVDVRESPWSPEPDFRDSNLAESLKGAGIAYVSLKAAGNPYRPPAYRDLVECLQLYAEKVEAQGLAGKALEAAGRFSRPCLLCACRKAEACHRGLLAQAMLRALDLSGPALDVLHLPADLQGSLFGEGGEG